MTAASTSQGQRQAGAWQHLAYDPLRQAREGSLKFRAFGPQLLPPSRAIAAGLLALMSCMVQTQTSASGTTQSQHGLKGAHKCEACLLKDILGFSCLQGLHRCWAAAHSFQQHGLSKLQPDGN